MSDYEVEEVQRSSTRLRGRLDSVLRTAKPEQRSTYSRNRMDLDMTEDRATEVMVDALGLFYQDRQGENTVARQRIMTVKEPKL